MLMANLHRLMIAPSLMGMDFLHVDEQLQILNRHFDLLHFDVMDGNFCKNIALSPDFLKAVRSRTTLPIDVHLMVSKPNDFLIDRMAENGASSISVHAESVNNDGFRTITHIHEINCQAGIVVNPMTSLDTVKYLLGRIDLLTIMTVDVGFAGQSFIPEMLSKITEAKNLREANGWHYLIQIDGHCTNDNYKRLYEAGADIIIVGGTGLYSLDKDLEKACQIFQEQINAASGRGS